MEGLGPNSARGQIGNGNLTSFTSKTVEAALPGQFSPHDRVVAQPQRRLVVVVRTNPARYGPAAERWTSPRSKPIKRAVADTWLRFQVAPEGGAATELRSRLRRYS